MTIPAQPDLMLPALPPWPTCLQHTFHIRESQPGDVIEPTMHHFKEDASHSSGSGHMAEHKVSRRYS